MRGYIGGHTLQSFWNTNSHLNLDWHKGSIGTFGVVHLDEGTHLMC